MTEQVAGPQIKEQPVNIGEERGEVERLQQPVLPVILHARIGEHIPDIKEVDNDNGGDTQYDRQDYPCPEPALGQCTNAHDDNGGQQDDRIGIAEERGQREA